LLEETASPEEQPEALMLDQLFELSRKATESSLQMQQVMFKQWTQALLSASPAAVGISADWGGSTRKQWVTFMVETLNKQRESIDQTYRAGIQMIEQVAHVSEAKSAEEAVRSVEEVWRKLFDAYKVQAETQFREFQTWAAKSFEMGRKAEA
jgi:hypothetical protein